MDSSTRRRGEAILEGLYRVFMRRTPVYVTFVVIGAFLTEQAMDYAVHKLWVYKNRGKLYEDIPVLGTRAPAEE